MGMNNTCVRRSSSNSVPLPFPSSLHSRESFATTSSSSSKSSKKGGHEKFSATDTETDQESLPASYKGTDSSAFSSSLKTCDRRGGGSKLATPKKIKRVQFQDGESQSILNQPAASALTPTLVLQDCRPEMGHRHRRSLC